MTGQIFPEGKFWKFFGVGVGVRVVVVIGLGVRGGAVKLVWLEFCWSSELPVSKSLLIEESMKPENKLLKRWSKEPWGIRPMSGLRMELVKVVEVSSFFWVGMVSGFGMTSELVAGGEVVPSGRLLWEGSCDGLDLHHISTLLDRLSTKFGSSLAGKF